MKQYLITPERLANLMALYKEHPMVQAAAAHIERIEAENAKLVKALVWYGDKSNHAPFSSEMRGDCGQLARTVLSELRGGENNE